MPNSNRNFYSQLQANIIGAADKPFLRGPDVDPVSYRAAEETSARIANLFAEKGLQPGDRVLTRTAKSPLALMVYLACLRSGVIYVPVNPACTSDELGYFVDDAEPALFIGDPDSSGEIAGSSTIPVLSLDDDGQGSLADSIAAEPAEHDVVESGGDDTAVIIYTSGTTGFPKGAMLSHANLAVNASTLYRLWGWSADDVLLHALPIFHVHGLFVALHLALLGTSSVIFLPRFDADAVIKHLPEATVFMGVPTFYTRLLQNPDFNSETCRNMRLFISGSAPLLEETFARFRDITGHTILERYGMSETGMLVSNPLDGDRVAGTVGYPLDGVETRIRDDQGREVAPGEPGILQVRGANVFGGYWRKPELNGTEFQDGFFITGDLVQLAPDGRISIVGRNKDMVISGGLNVYPREIEQVLDNQQGIRESAVFGVPHPDFGEGVVAAVVPEGGATLDTDLLLGACREQLAPYKCPKSIVVLSELPRNTMGKVQKNRLREEFAGLFQS